MLWGFQMGLVLWELVQALISPQDPCLFRNLSLWVIHTGEIESFRPPN